VPVHRLPVHCSNIGREKRIATNSVGVLQIPQSSCFEKYWLRKTGLGYILLGTGEGNSTKFLQGLEAQFCQRGGRSWPESLLGHGTGELDRTDCDSLEGRPSTKHHHRNHERRTET